MMYYPKTARWSSELGLTLGDIIEEGEQIHGDGVNIVARMESLAEAGGIYISGSVYDQVKNKLPLGYEFLGKQAVKDITEPVRVYRVLMNPGALASTLSRWKRTGINDPTGYTRFSKFS